MLRRAIFSVSLVFIALTLESRAETWSTPAHTWGGASTDSADAMALDSAGNLYVAGYTQSFAGGQDVLITKYNSTGQFLWAKTWGGSSDEYATAIKIGPDGFLYVTGFTSTFSVGWFDLYLLQLDANGNLKWGTTWGGGSYDGGHDIGFDARGNIYVVGESYSTGPCCSTAVLLKFSTSGTLIQSTYYKGPATYDGGYSLAVDSSFNVILAGISWDYSIIPLHNSILLLKYDPSGNLLWQENWSTPFPGQDESWAFHALTTDSANNIYIGGRHSSNCQNSNFSLCDFDSLLLKVDQYGSFQWAKTWGTVGTYDTAGSVALTSNGNVLSSAMEDEFGVPLLSVLSYDANGNLLSQTGWSQGTVQQGSLVGMIIDGSNNAYVASTALNNAGAWAATNSPAGSLTNSVVVNSYTSGTAEGTMLPLTTKTVGQTGSLKGGGGSDTFVAQYQSYMSGGPVLTNFPLSGLNQGTAQIISVFDHSMKNKAGGYSIYGFDGNVTAFTNEIGSCASAPASITAFSVAGGIVTLQAVNTFLAGEDVAISGMKTGTFLNGKNLPVLSSGLSGNQFEVALNHSNFANTPDSGIAVCVAKRDGYYNSNESLFFVNGHYVGDSSDFSSLKLQYDGHPGYDYVASCTPYPGTCTSGTSVYAAVSGTIHYPDTESMVGLGAPPWEYHVLQLAPSSPSYVLYYLHLSTYGGPTNPTPAISGADPTCTTPPQTTFPLEEGTYVTAGCVIAESGDTAPPPGVGPHLHFEVQKVFDTGTFRSYFNCLVNGLDRSCVPIDPYGWAPLADISGLTDPYTEAVNVNLWNVE